MYMCECGVGRELGIRLVNHHDARSVVDGALDERWVFGHASRVVGRTQKRHVWGMGAQHALQFVGLQREVGVATPAHHGGACDARDVGVQLVGGFKRGNRATRAAIDQQHGLQHFVAAVANKNVVSPHAMQRTDGSAQLECRTIGVTVPAHIADCFGESL